MPQQRQHHHQDHDQEPFQSLLRSELAAVMDKRDKPVAINDDSGQFTNPFVDAAVDEDSFLKPWNEISDPSIDFYKPFPPTAPDGDGIHPYPDHEEFNYHTPQLVAEDQFPGSPGAEEQYSLFHPAPSSSSSFQSREDSPGVAPRDLLATPASTSRSLPDGAAVMPADWSHDTYTENFFAELCGSMNSHTATGGSAEGDLSLFYPPASSSPLSSVEDDLEVTPFSVDSAVGPAAAVAVDSGAAAVEPAVLDDGQCRSMELVQDGSVGQEGHGNREIAVEEVVSSDGDEDGDTSGDYAPYPPAPAARTSGRPKRPISQVSYAEDESDAEELGVDVRRRPIKKLRSTVRPTPVPKSTASGRRSAKPRATSAAPTSDAVFLCDICGFSSKRSHNLKTHVDAVHRGEKPFKCDHCESRFTRDNDRKVHVTNKHWKLPEVQEQGLHQTKYGNCPHCAAPFIRPNSKDKHKCDGEDIEALNERRRLRRSANT